MKKFKLATQTKEVLNQILKELTLKHSEEELLLASSNSSMDYCDCSGSCSGSCVGGCGGCGGNTCKGGLSLLI